MLDSLRYYWRTNVAVALAAAVATAVLTGALLVGDSVRGSLRELTLDRLGAIDEALLSEGFFPSDLSALLAADPAFGGAGARAVSAILLQGGAVAPDSGARSSRVNIQGVDEGFAALYADAVDALRLDREEGQAFPSVVVNQALRDELGVEVGDQILLQLARPSDVPRESLLGSTEPSDLVQRLRVQVRAVLPDRGPGRFGLMPHQSLPFVAYVALADLQRALGQRGRVNALLLAGDGDPSSPASGASPLAGLVRRALRVEDLGLEIREVDGGLAVSSRELVLRPPVEEAVHRAAAGLGVAAMDVSTYLANRTWPNALGDAEAALAAGRLLPYSTVTALESPPPAGLGELVGTDGVVLPPLGAGEIVVNAWAAEDLGAQLGDRLTLEYWEVGEREELIARTATFELVGIAALEGLGADPALTPDFPGVSDADDMSEWDPTFPVDLGLIRDRDERYWDEHRGAPKLFVAEQDGRRLWGSRFGEVSSVRLPLAPAEADRLRAALLAELDPRAAGISVLPVKAQGLAAAKGATNFGGLFLGFSLFLIVAAALLVALFFRLGTERRAREIGIRLAIGTPVHRVRRGLLAEGAALAGLGGLLGLALAIAYGAALVWGLRTLWVGAMGTPFLELHVGSASLAIGYLASLLVVLVAIWRAVGREAHRPVIALLKGARRDDAAIRAPRRARRVAVAAAVLAALLWGASLLVPESSAAWLFFAVGALLLVAGLAAVAVWIARPSRTLIDSGGVEGVARLARANASLNAGRSLLSVALVASACFVIVAVGAYGHRFGADPRDRDTGGGGFQWIAEADVPIYHDLSSADGRFELGLDEERSAALEGSTFVPFRVLDGDDVSCLNLYQPQRPRLLGVPPELIERGGFVFQGLIDEGRELANPWTLLERDLGADVIPAFGDYNSVLWILKSGLGRDIVLEDELGGVVRLRLVGLLRKSVFQGELLVAGRRLAERFPSATGFRTFLVETPPGREREAAAALEAGLVGFGLDVTGVAQRIQSYQAVENTYLATFQLLGGLGLLLGTVGLAVILLRNVLERAGELATLRAVGFRRRTLAWTVVAENALLLLTGIGLGAAAALAAVSPHLRGGHALVPWGSLALTLAAVAAVGTLACVLAVRSAMRLDLLAGLRSE
ncbi:MAG TPA: FtsX-like permease family protein [Thermoanaerobaculia bacterium]|nr:FtsX-like permease family protein [Thermoanaerobaculia bacterium]